MWSFDCQQQTHIFLLAKNMTCNKLTMGKGSIVKVLFCTTHPLEHIKKKYPNMERVHRIENYVVLRRKMKKMRSKEAGCILFTDQYFRDGEDSIKLYALEWWCQISTEVGRHLFFSDGNLEERMETAEVGEMVEEVVELANLAVLVEG